MNPDPGPETPARASSSTTTTLNSQSPPPPPYASSMLAHSRPCSPALRQSSRGTTPALSQARWYGTISASMKRRTAERKISCSSEKRVRAIMIAVASMQAQYGDGRHAQVRNTPQVVRQSETDICQLTLPCPPEQLVIDFIHHAQARRGDRMTEAFEAAIDLAREPAIAIVESIQNVAHGPPLVRQEQILHGHELGNRQAVIHLDEAELGARLGDARLLVSLRGGVTRVADVASVPLIRG